MMVRNQAAYVILFISPFVIFKTTYDKKPNAIPSAIENVKGIIIKITKAGRSSVTWFQSSFSIPPNIKIATYIKAPAVAYAGIIDANGDKNIERINKNPTITAVRPVLPPASTPAELST